MKQENCCTDAFAEKLGASFWEAQYVTQSTGWDLGTVSPPIKAYTQKLANKNCRILIPGGGNSHEAQFLLEEGFTNITVIDIAPTPVTELRKKFENNPHINVILGDFFELQGQYDLILEQTFFCALQPYFRQRYVWKMHQLLSDNGILAGVLFNRSFDKSPPFGGSKDEYQKLFADAFNILKMEVCLNSVPPRAGFELFIEFRKNAAVVVNLYSTDENITMNDSKEATENLQGIQGIKSVSINSTFSEILLVSDRDIATSEIKNSIASVKKITLLK